MMSRRRLHHTFGCHLRLPLGSKPTRPKMSGQGREKEFHERLEPALKDVEAGLRRHVPP